MTVVLITVGAASSFVQLNSFEAQFIWSSIRFFNQKFIHWIQSKSFRWNVHSTATLDSQFAQVC